MTDETHTLHIKNMVCHRCILAVDHALRALGLHPLSVELGIAVTAEELTPDLRLRVKEALEALEFELIDDRRMQTVQQMKDLIIGLVHQPTDAPLRPENRAGQRVADLWRTDTERDSRPPGLLEHRLPERAVQERDGPHPHAVQATERETPQTAGRNLR